YQPSTGPSSNTSATPTSNASTESTNATSTKINATTSQAQPPSSNPEKSKSSSATEVARKPFQQNMFVLRWEAIQMYLLISPDMNSGSRVMGFLNWRSNRNGLRLLVRDILLLNLLEYSMLWVRKLI